MAPTPASQANAVPILRNPTRRRAGVEAGAADGRSSDSISFAGKSLFCIMANPVQTLAIVELSEVAAERPSEWQH